MPSNACPRSQDWAILHAECPPSALNQGRGFPIFIPGAGVLKCKARGNNSPAVRPSTRILFSFPQLQVFLLRGAFLIEGQERVTETAWSYLAKGEIWIGLYGSTTLIVLEEGG